MKTSKLLFIILSFAFISLVAACSGAKSAQTDAKPDWQTAQILTSAQCDMCKTRIEGALVKVKGVKAANLDMTTRQVTVKYDAAKTSIDQLRTAIASVGYDADQTAANASAYQKLPACCKKSGH